MGFLPDPRCTLCTRFGAPGTFFHMFWDCPPVAWFWNVVASQLSVIFSLVMPVSATVLLLNDLSQLPTTKQQKIVILAGLTAAKKLVALRWKHPGKLNLSNWILAFLDVIYLEISTAHVNGVKESNIVLWVLAAESLKGRI